MTRYAANHPLTIGGVVYDRGQLLNGQPVSLVPGDAQVAVCRVCGKQFISPEDVSAHIKHSHSGAAGKP